MARHPLRTAAATSQIGLGLPAVLLCAFAITFFVDPSSVEGARGLLVGICLVQGATMFAVWMVARTRRGWLLVLAVICGSLAVSMITVTARLYAPTRVDEHLGIWAGIAFAAVDVVLWLLITVAAIIEWRVARVTPAGEPRRWMHPTAIVAPLALITALVVLLMSAGPGWLIRMNSRVSEVVPPVDGPGSTLSGDVRWSLELDASHPALALDAGVAVPVAGDNDHSAGVVMIDPVNGELRWRYELPGALGSPELAITDGGRGLVVTLDEVDDDVMGRRFALDADSGQVRGVWPEVGAVADTDPPVLFDREAQGTNAVIAISPAGRKLWTHRPERCADPRSVTSTPEVILVRARTCGEDHPSLQILGLDARTGEERWVQEVPEDEEGRPVDGDKGPEQVVVRPAHQLELGGSHLARRDLDTGVIDWTATEASGCSDGALRASSEVAYLACGGRRTGDPTTIAAYAVESGQRRWQQRLDQTIPSVAAVDDRSVLALADGPESCTLQMIGEAGSTTLMTLSEGDRSTDPGRVNCVESDVLRVGRNFVLQVRLVGDSSDPDRYRFIGLS